MDPAHLLGTLGVVVQAVPSPSSSTASLEEAVELAIAALLKARQPSELERMADVANVIQRLSTALGATRDRRRP